MSSDLRGSRHQKGRLNTSAFTVDPIATLQNNAGSDYNLVERIGAGYIMNVISFGRFRLNTGIRFETTTESVWRTVLSADDQGNFLGVSSVTKNYTYVDPLPSAELRISLASNSALRLSYGRGIARPQFGDLAPNLSLSIASENGGRNTSSAGNPNLKATFSDNYNILFELYLKPLGLFTGGSSANAIHHAIGVRMNRLPMNPVAVMEAIWAQQR